jgi:DNA-binding LytR/AlgR family response regulator
MPDENGFLLAKRIRRLTSGVFIIFVTWLKEYMHKSFESQAFDYLCKPVSNIMLKKVMDRMIKIMVDDKDDNRLSVKLKGENGTAAVPKKDILYIESQLHYKKIVTLNKNENLMFYGNISEIKKRLVGSFVQISKSFLVNMSHIWIVRAKEIVLDNGKDLTVSRNYSKEFNLELEKYRSTQWSEIRI